MKTKFLLKRKDFDDICFLSAHFIIWSEYTQGSDFHNNRDKIASIYDVDSVSNFVIELERALLYGNQI